MFSQFFEQFSAQRVGLWSGSLVLLTALFLSSPAWCGDWLYVHQLRSGGLHVVDLAKNKVRRTLPVLDGTGAIGFAVRPDGKKIYIADGRAQPQLRVLNPATGGALAELDLARQVKIDESRGRMHLAGQYLVLPAFNSKYSSQETLVFDTVNSSFVRQVLDSEFRVNTSGALCKQAQFGGRRSLLAVCPDKLLMLVLADPGLVSSSLAVEAPLGVPDDWRISSDETRLYLLQQLLPGQPWVLWRWRAGSPDFTRTVLDGRLRTKDGKQPSGARAWLDVSPDGSQLALLRGNSIWLLDAKSLSLIKSFQLPWRLQQIRFSSSGGRIYSFLQSEKLGAAVLRLTVNSGMYSLIRMEAAPLDAPVAVFKLAPSPIGRH